MNPETNNALHIQGTTGDQGQTGIVGPSGQRVSAFFPPFAK